MMKFKQITKFYTPFDSCRRALSDNVKNIFQGAILTFVYITRICQRSCQNSILFTDLDSTHRADHEYV